MKTLIEYITAQNIRYLAIIGLAKNAGKTVAFNQIIREAARLGLKIALVSYGRDGEEVDAITRKSKPRIHLSPGMVFVTAEGAYLKSRLKALLLARTSSTTLLGRVNIYRSQQEGLIELTGVNSTSRYAEVKGVLPDDLDLVIIDGALDRRSSAVPALNDGVVIATGAVIGNTEELVIQRTALEYAKLTLPGVADPRLIELACRVYGEGNGALLKTDGKVVRLKSRTTFSSAGEIARQGTEDIDTIFIKGALTDSLVEEFIFSLKLRDCRLIVQDGTRVFLNQRNLKILEHYRLGLQVLNRIRVSAVTVNPVSPSGLRLNSRELVYRLRQRLPVPVFDLWSEEYRSIFTTSRSVIGS